MSEPGRSRRVARRIAVVLGGAGATVSAALVLGVFLPGLPVVGTLGSLVWPWLAAPGAVIALVSAGLAALAWRLGVRRTGVAFTVLGLAATAGCVVVVGDQVAVGNDNGVSTSIASALVSVGPGTATPDDTVEYGSFRGDALTLDVYRPAAPPAAGAPVVMYVHGGGWSGGSAASQAATQRWWADQGYLSLGVDYTLSSDDLPTWDIAAGQVQCAMAWVEQNAEAYGGDPDRFAVYGESAGGQLTLAATYAAAAGQAQPACEGDLPAVGAVMAEVPAVDMASLHANDDLVLGSAAKGFVEDYLGGTPQEHPDRAAAVAPSTYLGPGSPPTLLLLNTSDHLVPVEAAQEFLVQAQDAGVDIRALQRRWTDHTTSLAFDSVHTQVGRGVTLDFFRSQGV